MRWLACRRVRDWAQGTVLLWLFLLLIVPAVGQSDSRQTEQIADTPLEQLGNVRVYSASKHLQTITEAPSFVTVITGDQIRKFGYRTLAEVLQSVAGFYIDYDRSYTYVGVRGFGRPGNYNSRILLLLDGHRMNESIYDGAYVGTEFPLDLALVERVEIARGPSAALYGTNAFFAVVNVVTQSPEKRKGMEISFDAASFGTYSGSVRFGVDLPAQARLLVSGTAYESAGPSPLYFPGFDTPETNHGMADHADEDGFRTLLLTLARPNFRLQAFYSARTKGIPTGTFGTVFNDRRARTFDRRSYGDLAYSKAINDRWSISARGYLDYYGYWGIFPYATDSGGVELNRDYCVGTWLGGDFNATVAGWKKHSLTVGSEFRANLRQDQGSHLVGEPVPIFHDRHDSRIWAVYVQDEFAVAKPLVLYLGVRHDHYSQFGGTTNPRLGAVYRPWLNTAFKLIYGTAFRAPNAWELYYKAFGFVGNTSLKPEHVRTVEVVAEHSFAGLVRVTGSLFTNRISQLIDQDQNPDGTLIFRNLGKVSARGFEAQVEAKWHDELQARLSYTFQQTRDELTMIALSNSPRHLAKLNLIVPLKRDRLFAGLEAQYTARRVTEENEPVPRFGVFNLTAFAPRVARNLDFSVSVFNLFNRRYAAAESDPTIAPVIQDGRTARVKLTYRF